jgi:hypothetical protein
MARSNDSSLLSKNDQNQILETKQINFQRIFFKAAHKHDHRVSLRQFFIE